MPATAPLKGFDDLAIQSQSAFRAIMNAMAEPGKIIAAPEPIMAPEPLNPVAAMTALALCDFDTPIWLDPALHASAEILNFLTFHTGAPIVEQPENADFVFISSSKKLGDLTRFARGTDTYPDRSATLLVQAEALTNATGVPLKGPGIETVRTLGVAPLADNFWPAARANHALYPRGLDFIFCSSTELTCLPRSTKIDERS